MQWSFYTVFLGTIGSIIGHGYIALTEHDRESPKTLSELAAADQILLKRFRGIALTCSTLMAITLYWFIAPRNSYGLSQSIAWSLEYFGGILMLLLPAKDKYMHMHNICAKAMAVGMLALAYLFLPVLHGTYFITALICALIMTIFGIATLLDKRHFIVYELAFIFTSHITICIAALGLR